MNKTYLCPQAMGTLQSLQSPHKIIMDRSPQKSRRISTISHCSEASPAPYKLRTVYKGRGSNKHITTADKLNPEMPTLHSRLLQQKSRLSFSAHSCTPVLSRLSNRDLSTSRNTGRRCETINFEEELVLGGREEQAPVQPRQKYEDLMRVLEELDLQADLVIENRIRKVALKCPSIKFRMNEESQLSEEIDTLIQKIANLKTQGVEEINPQAQKSKMLINKKITLLQKLMAQKSTESQVLKNHFFAISAQSKKDSNKRKLLIRDEIRDRVKTMNESHTRRLATQGKQAICKESSNKIDYSKPQPHDYETYRYKAKQFTANKQPLPRSSYKSEYFTYGNVPTEPPFRKQDSYNYFSRARLQGSTYSKDYQKSRADIINFRELDSYRNKLRSIPVSYINDNKKQDAQKFAERSKRYILDQLKIKHTLKNSKATNQYNKLQEKQANNRSVIQSEAKRQYKGLRQINTTEIKNKELTQLKYAYKTLINNI